MEYNGETLLKGLKPLSAVKSMKDVKDVTYTQFPGTHCPLLGAIITARGIKDSAALVVGTDECVYYGKSFTIHSNDFGGLNGRCSSVRLDTNDVTFGSVEKVSNAFQELMEEYNPKCVFLISTCIVEIIGDDFDALAQNLSQKYNIPVLPVHTEHFKCEDHIPGIQRSLTACIDIMEKQERNNSVNILGQRMGEFYKTELAKILEEENIPLGMQLPNDCTLEAIRLSPAAKLNIVVNETAVELGKKMFLKFGIPYVLFDKFSSHDSNYNAYQEIFKHLNKPLPQKITTHYEKVKQEFEKHKSTFQGLKYIYGPTPLVPFEHIRMMCELGMEPQLVQLSRLDKEHQKDITEIIKSYDPYVTRSANVSGLHHIYDYLKPDLNMGPALSAVLKEKKIVSVRFDNSSNMLGLETSELFLKSLVNAHEEVKKIKEKN